MMRLPSKHGLERKYKPWRRGKSSSEKAARGGGGAGGGGAPKRPTNASLKNRLRSQRRLLAKLQNAVNGDEGAMEGVRKRIHQLESDIAAYEAREREKKNAAKYHQVKFIERQKLTRIEKSVKRQLQQLLRKRQLTPVEQERMSQLEEELRSIAIDQLYVAFYPTNAKYMALFANGTERVVDDERGQKRRRAVWSDIRRNLLRNLRKDDREGDDKSSDGSKGSGNDDDGEGARNDGHRGRKPRLEDARGWVDLDIAREALLASPGEVFPNAAAAVGGARTGKESAKRKRGQKGSVESRSPSSSDIRARVGKDAAAPASSTASDGRFALSKKLDGLFRGQSTAGDDYLKEMSESRKGCRGCDDEDNGSSSEEEGEEEVDSFQGTIGRGKKGEPRGSPVAKRGDESSSCSSSSSPSSSSDSHSNDESSLATHENNPKEASNGRGGGDDEDSDGQDDFFASDNKVSTEDAFARAKDDAGRKDRNGMPHWRRQKPDKSRGFDSQKNQSKRDYRAFRNRQKRHRFG